MYTAYDNIVLVVQLYRFNAAQHGWWYTGGRITKSVSVLTVCLCHISLDQDLTVRPFNHFSK